jgi:hypothetical protein
MQYLIMIYGVDTAIQAASPEQTEQTIAAYRAYTEAMRNANILVGMNRLRPAATATTLRNVEDRTKVLDGPYAETKEQLGGYCLIDVADLDTALSWARRCPALGQGFSVEVRPIWAMQS